MCACLIDRLSAGVQNLLQASARITDPSAQARVQEELLIRYAQTTHELLVSRFNDGLTQDSTGDRLERIRALETRYMPTARVWSEVFAQEARAQTQTKSDKAVELAYQTWRKKDALEATIAWADWLLQEGRGKAAMDVVNNFVASGKEGREELQRRWSSILNDQGAED